MYFFKKIEHKFGQQYINYIYATKIIVLGLDSKDLYNGVIFMTDNLYLLTKIIIKSVLSTCQ
jgi:hypothetical protein